MQQPKLTNKYHKHPPSELAEKFTSELNQGMRDTLRLREVAPELYKTGWNVYSFSDITGVEVMNCNICSEPTFVSKTISAYTDAFWVCEFCKEQYSWCKECNTYILTLDIDNPSHKHITAIDGGGGIVYPNEGEKAVWNADIMDSKKMFYFKTKEENIIFRHQKENHKQDNFRYFGVELEVEKSPITPPDILYRVHDMLGDKFVLVKHDGSLANKGKDGFEIVSVPATIKYHKGGAWDRFYDHLGKFFQERPPTTGLHVHINLNSIGKLTAGKMLLFINSEKNKEFIERIAQRELGVPNPNGKIYANIHEDWKISDVLRLKQHDPGCPWDPVNKKIQNRYVVKDGVPVTDSNGNPIISSLESTPIFVRRVCKCTPGTYKIQEKYEAFNLKTKRPTVELRIFRGIVTKFFLYMALEFVDALADFCAENSPTALTYRDFLNWMTQFNPSGKGQLYPSLSRHLVNEGWLDPPKSPPSSSEDIVSVASEDAL